MAKVKVGNQLTLRDRISRLSFDQAARLLGPQGKRLILAGAHREVDFNEDVSFNGELFRVTWRTYGLPEACTTLTLGADSRDRLAWSCDRCEGACEHVGAMFSLILEHKMRLGLAAPPPERRPVAALSEKQLVTRALAERQQRARTERMQITSSDPKQPWVDYQVESQISGKTYRVALRGFEPGESYCSCPDYRTNTLGTCKHVMKVADSVKQNFSARQLSRPYKPTRIEVHLRYQDEVRLFVAAPDQLPDDVAEIVDPLLGKPVRDIRTLLRELSRLESLGYPFHIYPDAEEYIQQHLHALRLSETVETIRRDPANHPLRKELLKVQLLPYQLDGIAFVAGAGRAVLADDMGLGKTIQAVGAAEFLARHADVRKVLVVCPASLKSQWRNEIERFCDRSVQLITGPADIRPIQYANDCFFTVCNYEQVVKDIGAVENCRWDMIVLDEGQRIKNWEAKTTRVIKGLRSRFALVLSGTPLENRLEELYSVVQFIDDRRLGPGFRFFNTHCLVDEKGKTLGYRNLDQLRERLQGVLLRRTRESVRLELPERNTEIVRIAPSDEQKALHDAHMQNVMRIIRKKFLTEMDLMRLRMSLLMCRMAADASVLVDKQNANHSTKLERLGELFDDLADESDRKVVLFSEWTSMLDLIEPLLQQRGIDFVRLDGSVPQKDRQALVERFQSEPECQYFLTTNAGSTGLNLQAANTVINVDLPWNPAVLEQRIARAHRMGQRQRVHVMILVTEGTLEESLLSTLSAKKELALAALDPESDVDTVEMNTSAEDLRNRLEVLLGAQAAAPVESSQPGDISQQTAPSRGSLNEEHRQRVAEAGGQLLGAVFGFLDQLISGDQPECQRPPESIVRDVRQRLNECVETDADGRPRLTLTLPNPDALDGLAQTLARLLVASKGDNGQ